MADQLAKIVFLGLVASNFAFAEVENVPDWKVATFSGDWGAPVPAFTTRVFLWSSSTKVM